MPQYVTGADLDVNNTDKDGKVAGLKEEKKEPAKKTTSSSKKSSSK